MLRLSLISKEYTLIITMICLRGWSIHLSLPILTYSYLLHSSIVDIKECFLLNPDHLMSYYLVLKSVYHFPHFHWHFFAKFFIITIINQVLQFKLQVVCTFFLCRKTDYHPDSSRIYEVNGNEMHSQLY